MKKHIPNTITLINLFCGCLSVVFAFENNLIFASLFIGIAAVFDFFDGFMARILHAGSPIGKQLDSLADVVSFGLAPGVIIYQLLLMNINLPQWKLEGIYLIPLVAFLIPMFSALRLAKFNIDERQLEVFYGLPTPANALLIASIPLILNQSTFVFGLDYSFIKIILSNSFFLISLSLLLSWLLVAEIPLFSLKFKNFKWEKNKYRFFLIIISVILFVLVQFAAIPLIIFTYILLSLSSSNVSVT
ncbi:MAG: CDP-alcohol phosphatidyltransferase family protein [Bacteroidales bacterium]|nr:CDP-alcohol phosphatidyltransferase family protein [Bacteroidales bacterium]MCF8402664.1 CDP-alcohol phosphatidyltransferase family protein [Bacteroidales bacterium]